LTIDDDDDASPMTIRILALVGDCYGAPGGIARYNQDLFESLVTADPQGPNARESQAEIFVVPRLGDARSITLPARIHQWPPVFSRLLYSLVSFWVAWRHRPIDIVFCGHVYMAPLAWALARFFGARYWLQTHGVDIWTPQTGLKRAAVEKANHPVVQLQLIERVEHGVAVAEIRGETSAICMGRGIWYGVFSRAA